MPTNSASHGAQASRTRSSSSVKLATQCPMSVRNLAGSKTCMINGSQWIVDDTHRETTSKTTPPRQLTFGSRTMTSVLRTSSADLGILRHR